MTTHYVNSQNNYNRKPHPNYNPTKAREEVEKLKALAPLPGYSENAQVQHAIDYSESLAAGGGGGGYANSIPEPLAPSTESTSNSQATPVPMRALSAAGISSGPSGSSTFKPSIGSAFGTFKKKNGGRRKRSSLRKNLRTRRRRI